MSWSDDKDLLSWINAICWNYQKNICEEENEEAEKEGEEEICEDENEEEIWTCRYS